MAAHAMHYPRRRRRWPQRILGFLATVAFLGSGVAIAMMVMPEKDQAAPAPQTDGAAVKGASQAKKPPLTKAQKRARANAIAKLHEEGYDPTRLADWKPRAPLKVLVGRSDTEAMRAYFFADGEFIGYDDPSTSGHLRVVKSGGNSVTLAYKLTDGTVEKVRFEYADGTLTPTGPVPYSSLR
jgi:hypothetical protein